MAETQNNKDRLKEIIASIEDGIQNLFQSESYAQYLNTMSRFHRYSVNNQVLIHMQKPDATLVAGFNRWKTQFGRNVIRGERGIRIIAPAPFRKKTEQKKLDPDTKLPMLDADGRVIMEERTIQIPMYRPVTVFDVSQTEGKPLPQLAHDLTGNVANYESFMEALRRSAPVSISIEDIDGKMDGYFDLENQEIVIRSGMSEVQTVSAVIHEMAHALLHNKESVGEKYQRIELFGIPALFSNGRIDRSALPEGLYAYDLRSSDDDPGMPVTLESFVVVNHAATVITAKPVELPSVGFLHLGEDGLNFIGGEQTVKEFLNSRFPDRAKLPRSTEEVQAESVSYAVCAYYGIATGENSFGYIASWSKDKTLPELRESLEVINRTAGRLIDDIDRHYAEIMQTLQAEQNTAIAIEPPVEEAPNPAAALSPDPATSEEARNACGYMDDEMLPLTRDRAMELFERDVPIYLLYKDSTECKAFDRTEILNHGGIFGIDRTDWEVVKEQFPAISQNRWQKAFLRNPADGYCIYQLKESEAALRFMNYNYLRTHNLEPSYAHYDAVYSGTLSEKNGPTKTLDDLYLKFNAEHPQDFAGHSLSVSDIVALKQNGMVSCHYVDSIGFAAVPAFIPENYLKNAEMAMEDDYGMIDGIINNGPKEPPENKPKAPDPMTLFDEARRTLQEKESNRAYGKRPSVLAKLLAPTPPRNEETAQKKSAERDWIG